MKHTSTVGPSIPFPRYLLKINDGTCFYKIMYLNIQKCLIVVSKNWKKNMYIVYCCPSATKSCPTLCDPMDCSMPGYPVPHSLLELAQIHVHRVSDFIQPYHPLPSVFYIPLPSVFYNIRVFSSELALLIR